MKNLNSLPHITLLQTFGVLCVIMGHAFAPFMTNWYQFHFTPNHTAFRTIHHFIYSFHMPLFFFISGYLYATKNKLNWLNYNIKRFKRLIIPFCIFGPTLFITLYSCFYPTEFNIRIYLKEYFLLHNTGHLWFLPALFSTTLIYSAIMSSPLKKHYVIVLIITIICYKYHNSPLHILLRQSFKYMIYMHLGYIAALKNIDFNNKTLPYFILGYVLYLLISDLQLKLRFLYISCFLTITFFTISKLVVKKLPQTASCTPIRFISKNMFIIYILSDPTMITILKLTQSYNPTTLNIFLFLFVGTFAITSCLIKLYTYVHPLLQMIKKYKTT